MTTNHYHPGVIDINEDLHCFLMKDAGLNLRAYLKNEFQPDLLIQAIREFTEIQRSTEKHGELLKGFMLAQKLWPIFGAFGCYRLMRSVDLQAFRSYYSNKPNRLADSFKEYIASAC